MHRLGRHSTEACYLQQGQLQQRRHNGTLCPASQSYACLLHYRASALYWQNLILSRKAKSFHPALDIPTQAYYSPMAKQLTQDELEAKMFFKKIKNKQIFSL